MDVIIVDDEIDACKNLQQNLMEYGGGSINIVAIAYNTEDAEVQINKLKPDVVFLDIEMPNENAFEFLHRIYPFDFEVIFVTAYDEYAIKAFKLNALDYILKPISIEEITMAVKKAKDRVMYKKIVEHQGEEDKDDKDNLYEDIKSLKKLDKVRLKDNSGCFVVDFKDIIYVEAKGSYSNICFTGDNKHEKNILTSNTVNDYEDLFSAGPFFRIHRTYLINCEHVKKLLNEDGSFVMMKNNMKLPVSRRRLHELMEFFKKL